jgi:hypothetical protein
MKKTIEQIATVAAFGPISILDPNAALKGIMIGTINPVAVPALTIAGIFFLIINLLAGAYVVRHWGQLFGRDPNVYEDVDAVRWLRMIVILVPLLVLTFRLSIELVGLWIN